MPSKEPKRGHTITPPGWWVSEVERRRDALRLTQKELAAAIIERAGQYDGSMGPLGVVDQSRVSRCLSGETSPIGLLWLVSSALGLPSPVIIPSGLADARQLSSLAVELAGSVRSAKLLGEAETEFSELRAESLTIARKRQPGGQSEVLSPPGGKPSRRRS